MTISLLRHLTPGHEALSPCGICSYAIDCRIQSCPNTRWRRIGGGNRAADTALTRPCQQCLPVKRGTPSGLAPFAGNGILRTEPHAPRCEAVCFGCPVSKPPPQSVILMLLTKGRRERQSAIRQQIHPHQTGGVPAENESRRPSRTGSAPSSAPNPPRTAYPHPCQAPRVAAMLSRTHKRLQLRLRPSASP
jgi:hypothetical protein